MASIFDVSVSSDSEDDIDYVPTGEVAPSDSSGDDNSEEEEHADAKPKRAKKKKSVKSQEEEVKEDSIPEIDPIVQSVDQKKRADDIWKSFLNDVESNSVAKSNTASPVLDKAETSVTITPVKEECTDSKVPVKEVFEFAGETFTIDNEPNLASHPCCGLPKQDTSMSATASETKVLPKKRGGLDSVLGTLMSKKQKMTTLQKTLYDWKTFKKAEGIEEDLEKYNKGKGGFVERQRFLQRSDVRSFEAERNVRQSKKKK